MATPTIAGNAVLLRQFFSDGFYPRGFRYDGSLPDLIFADGFDGVTEVTLGASEWVDAMNPTGAGDEGGPSQRHRADQLAATFPNTGTGWGRAWLDGNLWFKDTMPGGDDSRRLRVFERTNAAGLETGDINEYTIANVAAGVEFRVTLTWFDPEASPGAASTLINNLDLEVVGPRRPYLGNVFTGGVSDHRRQRRHRRTRSNRFA